ncbi:MAG: tRNA (guanosine(37)-N1)-methyltransferase TrmD [Pseudomonadota bacterium]|jgi:tRNA (guanine37-N1)-methyltransferase|nr:tRNA (guanosine(37)-N1)-methyltransferase TrmD [Alphaproteobacteria bacterium]
MWQATVFTLFPETFPGPLGHSIAGKAQQQNLWKLNTINIRDFALDKHKTVDDTSYGGGTGMVMRPDVIHSALTNHVKPNTKLIYASPKGRPLTQNMARSWLANYPDGINILCGRYEGVDQRVLDHWTNTHDLEDISIGDYILSGGELAALVMIDTCVRLLPEILEKPEATTIESFELDLLEYPQYTKPQIWNNTVVPDVLLSGDHKSIAAWRLREAEIITKSRRPDLWEKYESKQATIRKK